MDHVFISYARLDREILAPLFQLLRDQRDIRIWVDENDIPVSVPWLDEIEDALRGAIVVLLCDSPAWRASPNCQIEARRAEELGKWTWRVDATDVDPNVILQGLLGIFTRPQVTTDRATAELLVRTAQWDRNGRPSGMLARGRTLLSYNQLAKRVQALPKDTVEFLGRSSRSQRRRRLLSVLGTLVTVVALLTSLGTNAAKKKYDADFAKASQQHEYDLQSAELRSWNVYLELAEDSQESVTPSNSDLAYDPRSRLTTDLSINLPIEASGPTPHRAATASVLQGTIRSSHGSEASANFAALTIHGDEGRLTDVVTLASSPTALAWNTAGTDIAAATTVGIQIISMTDARAYETLAGFPKQVASLAWSAEDTHVTATGTDGSTATWNLTTGTVIQGVGADWFTGIAPLRGTDHAVAVTRTGTAVVINENTDQVERRINLPPAVYVALDAGGSRDAFAVGRSADSSILVSIDPVTGIQRTYPLGGCIVDGLAPSGDGSEVALGCAADQFAVLNVASGHITMYSVSNNDPVVSVGWAGRNGVIIGTERGNLFELAAGSKRVHQILEAECIGGGAEHILTTPDGRAFVSTGTDVSSAACSRRGYLAGSGWHLDHLAFGDEEGYTADSVAASPDGTMFAVGFSDGAIRTESVIQLDPRAVRTDAEGEVRGLAYSDDGQKLFAVTRDGEIIEYSTKPDSLTLDQMRTEAGQEAELAEKRGFFTPPGNATVGSPATSKKP